MKRSIACVIIALAAASASPASADSGMKVCGAKYRAAKADKCLPAGQTWNQFLAQCRGASAPAMHAAAAGQTPRAPRPESAAMQAMHQRQRQCGEQWRADKAAGRLSAGQAWAKYWSECNARLKAH